MRGCERERKGGKRLLSERISSRGKVGWASGWKKDKTPPWDFFFCCCCCYLGEGVRRRAAKGAMMHQGAPGGQGCTWVGERGRERAAPCKQPHKMGILASVHHFSLCVSSKPFSALRTSVGLRRVAKPQLPEHHQVAVAAARPQAHQQLTAICCLLAPSSAIPARTCRVACFLSFFIYI